MNPQSLPKPKKRSKLRKTLGKEFYVFLRKWKNAYMPVNWARIPDDNPTFDSLIIAHQSLLLRPLRAVEMQLQINKITNLNLAIQKLNGVVIQPGQTFSFWKLVGRPSRRKGFLDGLVLENGRISKGVGGGLCQLGNLLYWMMLHTSLTVTERWRHGYDVFPDVDRKLPFGSGATLSFNFVDLQCCNNTDRAYQLVLWTDSEFLYGEIRSEKAEGSIISIYETDHCFIQQWWGGYARCNKIWKRCVNRISGEQTSTLISENTAIMMYEPLLASTNDKKKSGE